MKFIGRIPALLGTASVALALSAAPAFAHVTANPGEAAAGGYTYHAFRVGHGCDGSPTTKVAVHIPDGVVSVKPQQVAGWKIAIAEGAITPYDSHGETISEGVKEVSWTASTPLPDKEMQQFGMSMKMPDKAGETIYFPVVQTCQEGVTRWISIPAEGQSEPEHPAAAVKLVAAADGDGHGASSDAKADEKAAGDSEHESESVAQSGQVGDDDNDTLAIVALAIGVLGLLTGGTALVRGRR